VRTSGEMSRRYIEFHNNYDLDGLLSVVDELISFKRAEEEPLVGAEAVRRLGEMRLYKQQLIPVGVAEPEHRRLRLRLFNGADANLDR
jgi:hypothetical protein